MPFINCPNCNKPYSAKSQKCPHCGAENTEYAPPKPQIEVDEYIIDKKEIPKTIEKTEKASKKSKLVSVLFLIIFVLSVSVIYLVINDKNDKPLTNNPQEGVLDIDNPFAEFNNDGDNVVMDNDKFDFQNSSWNDSMEKVKTDNADINLLPVIGENNALSSTTRVAGEDAIIFFKFENNQLKAGTIYFQENHTTENLYIGDYKNIKEILIDKYGQPIIDEEIWNDDLYKDDPTSYGFAVALGELTYVTIWETETTKITLILSGDNLKISHIVYYEELGHEFKVDDSRL